MAQKNINARFQNKHDVEVSWLNLTNFIPLQGEFIIYDPDENYSYPRVKVGDGVLDINSLPFITDGEFLKKTGDWMTGPFGLTKDVGYGINLPADGKEGQVFFLQDDSSSSGTGSNIPTPTEEDNGKFLRVVNGQPKWVSIPIAENASF